MSTYYNSWSEKTPDEKRSYVLRKFAYIGFAAALGLAVYTFTNKNKEISTKKESGIEKILSK